MGAAQGTGVGKVQRGCVGVGAVQRGCVGVGANKGKGEDKGTLKFLGCFGLSLFRKDKAFCC